MIRTPVLHRTPLPLPVQVHPKVSETNSSLKEEEYFSLLQRCRSMEDLMQIHARVLKLGFICNSYYTGKLLATCALSEWGSMNYACSIFRQIGEPGSFEFNTIIRGYVENMNLDDAIFLYDEMIERGVNPDNFTYPTLLKACAKLSALKEGMQIHGHIFKFGCEDDLFVKNSLINMYGKCGEIKSSCAVFEQMTQKSVASWSALVAAYARVHMWGECLRVFGEMIEGESLKVEESTLVSVLSACTHLGALDLGRCIHGFLLRNMGSPNVIVQTSLIDMYVKCGSLEKGFSLFKKMPIRNQLTYSVMISGLAFHGQGHEALRIFQEMLEKGIEPDEVVYVGLLTACAHGGLVEEGWVCLDKMRIEHRIEPTVQHYGCMVDLLGRAGLLSEALELIESIQKEPTEILWRSLLSACKVHHDLRIGEIAARNLFNLNSKNPSDYLVVSNMHARAHRWEDVATVRTEMASKGLMQMPGFSIVEVKRKFYKFVSQDMSHLQSEDIYEMIHQMEWQLKFEGYSPDTSEVLMDVQEEEKGQRLRYHSQKLAIACALINTPQGCPIKIFRNLRMCSDCHTYTKLISMIFARRITVRDRNRFHHFKDGNCSCGDYW